MEEANVLTDMTLVQYPSNHCFVQGLRILLIGEGPWKDTIINNANNLWETSLNFYYIKDDDLVDADADQLSWLWLNQKHVDIVLISLSQREDVSILSGLFLIDKKTYYVDTDNELSPLVQHAQLSQNPITTPSETVSMLINVNTNNNNL